MSHPLTRKFRPPWAHLPPGVSSPHRHEPPWYWDEEEVVLRKSEEADPIPDWLPEDTEIIRVPADRFQRAQDALEWFRETYGRVLQNCSTVRFWAARVYKKERER